ncbi:hypothetical protein [Lachnobacterium bovis]|uniref:Uncharacterized protein n=1 Tax=Lachnobacterium bovis DSM 14045 TaxID=1122142 RepID=A0A1H3GDY0_9FIRM|nr:hypothetical protein [Lachnobacterium bovis]SDY01481.1 hypothetical protein SAMN02910414_00542 [Lachnobacterium bovis DSM 14045]
MGFYVMLLAFFVGIALIATGATKKTNKVIRIVLIVLGIVSLGAAIYMGLPK